MLYYYSNAPTKYSRYWLSIVSNPEPHHAFLKKVVETVAVPPTEQSSHGVSAPAPDPADGFILQEAAEKRNEIIKVGKKARRRATLARVIAHTPPRPLVSRLPTPTSPDLVHGSRHSTTLIWRRMPHNAKLKIQDEFDRKDKDRESKRIALSAAIGSARLKKMKSREDMMKGIVNERSCAPTPGRPTPRSTRRCWSSSWYRP